MSAETTINNLLSTLRSLSTSYRGTASALVKQADDALAGLSSPDLGDVDFDVTRPSPTYTRVPLPPTLEGLDNLALPKLAKLQAISPVEDEFKGKAPTLKIPDFSAPLPGNPPTFTEKAPTIGHRSINPTAPTITETTPPALSRPTAVSVDPVSGEPPAIPLPVFKAFVGDFHDQYVAGATLIGSDIAAWHQWLKTLGDDWMQPLLGLLTARLRAVMVGTETGVPDDWEAQTYDQARQPVLAERWSAQRQLDDQPAAQTELPTGQRVWARLELELKTAQALMMAASKTSQERQTLEVKHLQWAMALAEKLIGAAMELRAQEAAWRMKGLLLAIEGATGALDLALKLLAFKERELAILVRYNELQVRRTEDSLKIELTKLESLRVTLEVNRQIATYNEQNIKVYEIAAGWVETRVKLFQQQISYLQVDIAWRKLALQSAESTVAAYSATVKAKNAEYEALQARIKGDLALVKAELAKVTLYEAEAAAFTAKVKQLTAMVQAQSSANDSKLQGYIAEISAKMTYLRQLEDYTKVALSAMTKGFTAETTEQELALSSQQLKDQQALYDALLEMQVEQTELMNELKAYQMQLGQAESIGRIMDQGAGTLGGIAASAYAGLNSVGTKSITEFA